jgi:hypothetical protein
MDMLQQLVCVNLCPRHTILGEAVAPATRLTSIDAQFDPKFAPQVTLGLVSALMKRGVKVGYQKPVGQQTVPIVCDGDELQVDRDVDIFKHVWPDLIGAPHNSRNSQSSQSSILNPRPRTTDTAHYTLYTIH